MEKKALYQFVGAGAGAFVGFAVCQFSIGPVQIVAIGVMALVGFFVGGAVGSSASKKDGMR